MSKNTWIDGRGDESMGDIGFLIEKSPDGKESKYFLSDRPAHTNQSNEPRLHGWCGSWNNITNGCGMAKIIRIAKNGRVLVSPVEGDELQAALDNLGYPDLA